MADSHLPPALHEPLCGKNLVVTTQQVLFEINAFITHNSLLIADLALLRCFLSGCLGTEVSNCYYETSLIPLTSSTLIWSTLVLLHNGDQVVFLTPPLPPIPLHPWVPPNKGCEMSQPHCLSFNLSGNYIRIALCRLSPCCQKMCAERLLISPPWLWLR